VSNDASAPERATERALTWLLWATWCVGPASYGAAFVYCWALPELCDDPPNVLLACVLMITHLAAGGMTLLLACHRSQWRAAEFWLLIVYWFGIGGWVLPALWMEAGSRAIDPTFPWLCTRISAVVAVLMPVAGLASRFRTRRRARTS
jgi:hypothetical protein